MNIARKFIISEVLQLPPTNFSEEELNTLNIFYNLFLKIKMFTENDIQYYFMHNHCIFMFNPKTNDVKFNVIFYYIFMRDYKFTDNSLKYFLKLYLTAIFKLDVKNVDCYEKSFSHIEDMYFKHSLWNPIRKINGILVSIYSFVLKKFNH